MMDWTLIAAVVAMIIAAMVVRAVLSAKLTLDARPRLPLGRSNLAPGPCAVVQDERPPRLIHAIKDLRALTGWNLRDTKLAVEGSTVVQGVSLEAAEQVVRMLETHGGRARVVEAPDAQGVAIQSKPTTASRCPYCHGVAGSDSEPVVACTACLARHHAVCWDENKQCAGCGHTERYTGVEQTEGRERSRGSGLKEGA